MAKWIKWEGGECPVATGTMVDVRYRDGVVLNNICAGEDTDLERDAYGAYLEKDDCGLDIISYRVHTTDENPITHKALAKLHAKLDRIERKIDAMNKPAVIRPKWMDLFIPKRAKVVLADGYKGGDLAGAFPWSFTSEGWGFWSTEDDNLRAGKPLSEAARTALTRMISEYEAAN